MTAPIERHARQQRDYMEQKKGENDEQPHKNRRKRKPRLTRMGRQSSNMLTEQGDFMMMIEAKQHYRIARSLPDRPGKSKIKQEWRETYYFSRGSIEIESESGLNEGDPVTARAWLARYAAGGQPVPQRGG